MPYKRVGLTDAVAEAAAAAAVTSDAASIKLTAPSTLRRADRRRPNWKLETISVNRCASQPAD
jgi:hypothetical protein